ncbi:hypothetical protein PQA73_gp37 [Erwinia phage Pavtok]|uniref:WDGH domain-containing protein n=1 Tax=Erwinia phage Pavtok TaxID=2267655 RepID=A0A345BLZ4_9CAUD|nr:hypothetical protein PQA73_gp37 [Erwinia phage Pavtok]AXF51465.1 hypothetical protein PAVTOK_37 [Erwinia phage Pavtok]
MATSKPNLQYRLASFAREYPDNTPVWYYPIAGDESTKRATWVRGEPWSVGDGEIIVKVKDATAGVSIEHLRPRELDARSALAGEAVTYRKHEIDVPADLYAGTAELVRDFAGALAEKLFAAQQKRAAADGWMQDDWQEDCQRALLAHLLKGDPLDVAAYAAFCWHHSWSTKPASMGEVSDGYHTFNELYAHRVRLFSCLMHAHRNRAWWSDHHADGTVWDGWVIAGITTPAGDVTYHLPVTEVPELPEDTHRLRGKEWDGHTAADVLKRLPSLNFGRTDGTAMIEPMEEVELVIYGYAASVAGPRGTNHWDGSIERPLITSHADYISLRKEIARDGNVAHHDAIQVHHLTPIGYTQAEPIPANNADLIRQLQQLGEDFGCPGGMNRIEWLRQRLTVAIAVEGGEA